MPQTPASVGRLRRDWYEFIAGVSLLPGGEGATISLNLRQEASGLGKASSLRETSIFKHQASNSEPRGRIRPTGPKATAQRRLPQLLAPGFGAWGLKLL